MAVSIKPMQGGINNQKFSLLGLLQTCAVEKFDVSLPRITDFVPGSSEFTTRAFGDVFDTDEFKTVIDVFKLNISAIKDYVDTWECFKSGTQLADRIRLRDQNAAQCVKSFFRHLRPILIPPIDNFDAVVQLRVEKDWISYAKNRMNSYLIDNEVLLLDPMHILRKSASCLVGYDVIYVCYDDRDVSFSFEELKVNARSELGLKLVSKRDLDLCGDETNLYMSLVDFEIASSAKRFVGTSRSTFSNIAALTANAREVANRSDWIYNWGRYGLAERRDAGISAIPSAVVSNDIVQWFRAIEIS